MIRAGSQYKFLEIIALEAVEHGPGKKIISRSELFNCLLQETLASCRQGTMTKSKSDFLVNAVHSLTVKLDDESALVGFARLAVNECQDTVSTQASRTKFVEFIHNLIRLYSSSHDDFLQFITQVMALEEAPWRRVLACEFASIAYKLSCKKVKRDIRIVLSARSRDKILSVRCSALKAMLGAISLTSGFALLEDDSLWLKAGLEAADRDQRPVPRRWGVKIISFVPHCEQEVFEVLSKRCRDAAASVRKASLESLGPLITRYSSSSAASMAFCNGVLPLLKDDDDAVASVACLIVGDVLLGRPNLETIWPLLYSLRSETEIECLGLALKSLAQRPELSTSFKELVERSTRDAIVMMERFQVQELVGRDAAWGIWVVLDQCRERLPGLNYKIFPLDFPFKAWGVSRNLESLGSSEAEEESPGAVRSGLEEAHALQRRVLRVLAACVAGRAADTTKEDISKRILQSLVHDLLSFTSPPTVASAMLDAAWSLLQANKDAGLARTVLDELRLGSEAVIFESDKAGNTPKLNAAVFLLGELSMLGFDPNVDVGAAAAQVIFPLKASDPIVLWIQALASPDFRTKLTSETLLSGAKKATAEHSTRALAFLTLGKFCLRDDAFARSCVVVFVKELSEQNDLGRDAVKCNALVVLGDLCRRFTNVVEPYVEKISTSLGDENAGVRKRCLLSLAALIQEDYVRLKPFLFYRFLGCVADPVLEISDAAKHIMSVGFLRRTPGCFHANAANAVFALGGLNRGRGESKAEDVDHGGYDVVDEQQTLVGIQRRILRQDPDLATEKRAVLYEFVFDRLDEAQKLETCNKIRGEVLRGLLDGDLGIEQFDLSAPVASPTTRVVRDAFYILQSDFARIKDGPNAKNQSEDGGEDDEITSAPSMLESNVARATRRILEALDKKNVEDVVVPLLVSLYTVSSRERSSLVKLIVQYLKFLTHRYKGECGAALAPHRDLIAVLNFTRVSIGVARKSAGAVVASAVIGAVAVEVNEEDDDVVMKENKEQQSIVVAAAAVKTKPSPPLTTVAAQVEVTTTRTAKTKQQKTPKVLRRVKASMMKN